jgi:hypothetical protein
MQTEGCTASAIRAPTQFGRRPNRFSCGRLLASSAAAATATVFLRGLLALFGRTQPSQLANRLTSLGRRVHNFSRFGLDGYRPRPPQPTHAPRSCGMPTVQVECQRAIAARAPSWSVETTLTAIKMSSRRLSSRTRPRLERGLARNCVTKRLPGAWRTRLVGVSGYHERMWTAIPGWFLLVLVLRPNRGRVPRAGT